MQDLKIQYYHEDNINMLWTKLCSDSLKHNFYRQLQFIADKRWDGSEVNEVPFGESYPRFAVMNMQQLPDSDAKTQLYDSDAHILYLCFCI